MAKGAKALRGNHGGAVFYGFHGREGLCYVRGYPRLTRHNRKFGDAVTAIMKTTWYNASIGFKKDMRIYTEAWNKTQQPDHDLPVSNIFMKCCFAVEKVFDKRYLTVANFGGKVRDLLGD